MWILKVEFCIFAPSNKRANLAEAELLICEINLWPATVFWDGGGMSSSRPKCTGYRNQLSLDPTLPTFSGLKQFKIISLILKAKTNLGVFGRRRGHRVAGCGGRGSVTDSSLRRGERRVVKLLQKLERIDQNEQDMEIN